MSPGPPPSTVLRAFGADGPPKPSAGGRGISWVAGELVLKPGGGPLHAWLAEALAGIEPEGFRLAAPVPTRDGRWECHGWSATRRVDGSEPDHHTTRTWADILTAGRAFHRAVAHLERPGFLDARQDWWARADRAVWGERPLHFRPEFADLARRLQQAPEPPGRPQIVHADLTGNVLFAPGLAPAVIDVSPYWRPPAYAEAVVVADALCWHDAPASLPAALNVPVAAVARALLFRMATTNDRVTDRTDRRDEARRYAHATAAIGR